MIKLRFADLRERLAQYPIFGELVIEIEKVCNSYRISLYDVGKDDVINVTGIDLKCLVMEFIADADGVINLFGHNWGGIKKRKKLFEEAELIGLMGQQVDGLGEYAGYRWRLVK